MRKPMMIVVGNKCLKLRGWHDIDAIAKRIDTWKTRMRNKGANKFTMRVLGYNERPENGERWYYLFCEALQIVK
jgi:hypothetical protein